MDETETVLEASELSEPAAELPLPIDEAMEDSESMPLSLEAWGLVGVGIN